MTWVSITGDRVSLFGAQLEHPFPGRGRYLAQDADRCVQAGRVGEAQADVPARDQLIRGSASCL